GDGYGGDAADGEICRNAQSAAWAAVAAAAVAAVVVARGEPGDRIRLGAIAADNKLVCAGGEVGHGDGLDVVEVAVTAADFGPLSAGLDEQRHLEVGEAAGEHAAGGALNIAIPGEDGGEGLGVVAAGIVVGHVEGVGMALL